LRWGQAEKEHPIVILVGMTAGVAIGVTVFLAFAPWRLLSGRASSRAALSQNACSRKRACKTTQQKAGKSFYDEVNSPGIVASAD